MKRSIFSTIVLSFLLVSAFASTPLELTNKIRIDRYEFPEPESGFEQVVLATPYGDENLVAPAIADKLKSATIYRIDLVYTRFRRSKHFDQKRLNRERMEELERKVPGIFDNSLTVFNLVEQTGCRSKEEGEKEYFHGFVIQVKLPPSPEQMEEEATYLEKVLEAGSMATVPPPGGSDVDISEITAKDFRNDSIVRVDPEFKPFKDSVMLYEELLQMMDTESSPHLIYKYTFIDKITFWERTFSRFDRAFHSSIPPANYIFHVCSKPVTFVQKKEQ